MCNLSNIVKNNLENIKEFIKKCAKQHSTTLINGPSENVMKKKISVSIENTIKALEIYGSEKNNDINLIEEKLNKLNNILNELSLCPVLVNSIFDENCFVTPAYDVIKIIFPNSDQDFRQRHFHELIERYYVELSKYTENLSNIFDKREFKAHVNFLLPYIKIEALNSKGESAKEILEDFYLYLEHPRFSKEDVYEIVRNKIGSSEYKLISFNLKPLDERRGHLGNYFHLNISIEFHEKIQSFRLFLKYIDQDNDVLQALIYGASLNEAFFYEELVKEFEKLGLDDLLTFAPNCYLSKASDLLVLDNMNNLGFTEVDHYTMLPYEGLKMIALQLARYHCCSFILENSLSKRSERSFELDEIYGKYFKELIFLSKGPSRQSFESFWDSVYYLIDFFAEEIQYKIPREDFKHIAKTTAKDTFHKKLCEKSTKFKNCICHGDLYASNTVLKEQNGKYVDACLLDFQTIRYLPPAHDILILIYVNTTKVTRDECMNQVLLDYYEELSRCFENHGLNVEQFYTKDQFDESVDYMKSQAVVHAFMYSHVLKASPEMKKTLFGKECHVYYLIFNRIKLVQRSLGSKLFRDVQKDYIQDLYELCVNRASNASGGITCC